jgi:hypothetical protein
MGWGDFIGAAVSPVLGVPKMIAGALGMGGGDSGGGGSVNINPYKEYTAQLVNAGLLRENINQQAAVMKDQNVAAFNSGIAGQRGVSSALAAQLQGNNLATANANQSAQASALGAQADMAAQQFNSQAQERAHALNAQSYYNAHGINAQYNIAQANRDSQLLGGIISGVGAAAMMASDSRLKEPVVDDDEEDEEMRLHNFIMGRNNGMKKKSSSPANGSNMKVAPTDENVEKFLASLTPHMYKYKEGSVADDGGNTHLGVMAQNLEKTEAGKAVVKDTPHGKMIDTNQLTGSLAASVGTLYERITKLEKALKSSGGNSKKATKEEDEKEGSE